MQAYRKLTTLGKSGAKVTRLAFGTGTFSGQTQRELGQDQAYRRVEEWNEEVGSAG